MTMQLANESPSYFDIRRDVEIVDSGGFFCRSCLVGKPQAEASPDGRYCLNCYAFLLEEASLLTGTTRPRWLPREQNMGEKPISVSRDGNIFMAHSKATGNGVRHNSPVGQKRGPKLKALPEQRIKGLYQQGEGLGAERISKALKGEGVNISARTVLRVIRGERRQIELPTT